MSLDVLRQTKGYIYSSVVTYCYRGTEHSRGQESPATDTGSRKRGQLDQVILIAVYTLVYGLCSIGSIKTP